MQSRIEMLCERCFSNCESLPSVTFDSDSKLQRIKVYAFAWNDFAAIHVLASIEMLYK
jgi:hypothetical protein